jgi:hypothetical protein
MDSPLLVGYIPPLAPGKISALTFRVSAKSMPGIKKLVDGGALLLLG